MNTKEKKEGLEKVGGGQIIWEGGKECWNSRSK